MRAKKDLDADIIDKIPLGFPRRAEQCGEILGGVLPGKDKSPNWVFQSANVALFTGKLEAQRVGEGSRRGRGGSDGLPVARGVDFNHS